MSPCWFTVQGDTSMNVEFNGTSSIDWPLNFYRAQIGPFELGSILRVTPLMNIYLELRGETETEYRKSIETTSTHVR